MRRAVNVERGFSIVEVIIAVVVVAIGLTGLAALSGSSAQSTTSAKVRDQQSSIAQSLGDKMRSDSAWVGNATETCSSLSSTPTIQLTGQSWLTQRMRAELRADGLSPEQWAVQATARKVDSPADGTCGSGGDKDGVLPDYYDVDIVVRPSGTSATRFPNVKPFVTSFQVNFASRTAGGTLTIQACEITPQVDERLPIGTCGAGSASDKYVVLPPAGSKVNPGPGQDPMTCVAKPLDCQAYRCAHPNIADNCPGEFGDPFFVKVSTKPGAGWRWTMTGDPADPVTAGITDAGYLNANGEYRVEYLRPGRYRINIQEPNSVRPWASHSVPADGWATVVSGIESRIVQMYKPAPRGQDLFIPIETTDASRPPWDGQPQYDYLYKKGPYELILVPVPRGRVLGATSGTRVNEGDPRIRFQNLEPGLYGAYMADPSLTNEYELSNTKQFLFVPPGGGTPIVVPAAGAIKWDVTTCDPLIRNQYSPGTHTYLYPGATTPSTWVWKPCNGPSGPGPGPGSGGSGGS